MDIAKSILSDKPYLRWVATVCLCVCVSVCVKAVAVAEVAEVREGEKQHFGEEKKVVTP